MNQFHIIRLFLFLDTIASFLPVTTYVDTIVSFGGTSAMAHVFSSMRSLCTAVTFPLFGSLSDSIGRKPILVIATLGLVINAIIELWASQLIMIFVGRFVAGVTRVTGSILNSVICDRTAPGTERMSSLTTNGIVFAVGFNVAVLSGGFLYPLGNRILSFLVLILSLVNLFVVMFLFEESKSQHTSKTVEVRPRNRIQMLKILWKSDLQLLILFHMAIVIFSNMFMLCFIEYGREVLKIPPSERGVLYFAIGLSLIVIKLITNKLIELAGSEKKAVLIGTFFSAFPLFGLPFSDKFFLYVFCLLFVMSTSFVPTITLSLISDSVSKEIQGSIMGLNESLVCIANVIGPLFVWFMFHSALTFGLWFGGTLALILLSFLSHVHFPQLSSKKDQ